MKKRNKTLLKNISIPLLAIFLSLIAIALIILLVGRNPLEAFKSLVQGAGLLPKDKYSNFKGQFTDFMETLDAMTPMLFAALSVATAMKAGLFNIGVSGQMMISGFAATVLVGYSGLNPLTAGPLVIIVGMLTGAAAGSLVGFLKYKFNINEVVSTIMLNYIFANVISFFIQTRYIDVVTRQSRNIKPAARLTQMDVDIFSMKSRIPLMIIFAVITAFLLYLYFKKTIQGFETKAVGLNPLAASYFGINVSRRILITMAISGALAGLAGVTHYLGYYQSMQPGILSSIGFDSIAVSLLANSNPIGIIFSSFLITVVSRGSTYMSSTVGVRQEIAQLVTGMILLFSACGAYIKSMFGRKKLVLSENNKEEAVK